MQRINWLAGVPPVAESPHVPVLRFTKIGPRYRVWMLGELKCKAVHHAYGENTVPCLAPEQPCPWCSDARWSRRYEGFAPVYYRSPSDRNWVPAVAAFTTKGVRDLGSGPHRGLILDIWRTRHGTSKWMQLERVETVEPPVPAFDMDPHLMRVWFPNTDTPLTVNTETIPAPIPIEEMPAPKAMPKPEPVRATPEQIREIMRKHGYDPDKAIPAPTSSASTNTPPPKPSAKPNHYESDPRILTMGSGEIVCDDLAPTMEAILKNRTTSKNGTHTAGKGGVQ